MSMYDIFSPTPMPGGGASVASQGSGLSNGALAGIGAIGTSLNAYMDRKGQEKMLRQQLDQLRQQIAYQERVRAEQEVLKTEEVQRQQIMARAGGDAFASSLGQFQGNVEGQVGDKTAEISALFRDYMSRARQGALVLPEATGPTADREASMRQQASADVTADTDRLSAVQAFGDVMTDKSRVMNQNDQLSSLIRNFATGSQGASNAEVGARAGKFVEQKIVEPNPSMLGDLFVVGSLAANKFMQPQGSTAVDPFNTGLRQGAVTGGFNRASPTGLGIGSKRI